MRNLITRNIIEDHKNILQTVIQKNLTEILRHMKIGIIIDMNLKTNTTQTFKMAQTEIIKVDIVRMIVITITNSHITGEIILKTIEEIGVGLQITDH